MLFKTNIETETSTEKKVNELLQAVHLRNSKIKESVESIDNQIKYMESKIADLMDKYVSLEMANRTTELKEIDKSINSIRLQIESLKGKRDAYSKLPEDKRIKEAIPKILESARKDKEERFEQFKKKVADKKILEAKLKEKINEMENQLESMDEEIKQLRVKKEVNAILPLLKYIEPRKIGNVDGYIGALLDNDSNEVLEQYLEKDSVRIPKVTTSLNEEVIQKNLIRQERGY